MLVNVDVDVNLIDFQVNTLRGVLPLVRSYPERPYLSAV
jgi:hypothetical protein